MLASLELVAAGFAAPDVSATTGAKQKLKAVPRRMDSFFKRASKEEHAENVALALTAQTAANAEARAKKKA